MGIQSEIGLPNSFAPEGMISIGSNMDLAKEKNINI